MKLFIIQQKLLENMIHTWLMMMIILLFMLPLVTYTEGKSGQIIALRIHSVYVHEVASYHRMMEEGRKANLS